MDVGPYCEHARPDSYYGIMAPRRVPPTLFVRLVPVPHRDAGTRELPLSALQAIHRALAVITVYLQRPEGQADTGWAHVAQQFGLAWTFP